MGQAVQTMLTNGVSSEEMQESINVMKLLIEGQVTKKAKSLDEHMESILWSNKANEDNKDGNDGHGIHRICTTNEDFGMMISCERDPSGSLGDIVDTVGNLIAGLTSPPQVITEKSDTSTEDDPGTAERTPSRTPVNPADKSTAVKITNSIKGVLQAMCGKGSASSEDYHGFEIYEHNGSLWVNDYVIYKYESKVTGGMFKGNYVKSGFGWFTRRHLIDVAKSNPLLLCAYVGKGEWEGLLQQLDYFRKVANSLEKIRCSQGTCQVPQRLGHQPRLLQSAPKPLQSAPEALQARYQSTKHVKEKKLATEQESSETKSAEATPTPEEVQKQKLPEHQIQQGMRKDESFPF